MTKSPRFAFQALCVLIALELLACATPNGGTSNGSSDSSGSSNNSSASSNNSTQSSNNSSNSTNQSANSTNNQSTNQWSQNSTQQSSNQSTQQSSGNSSKNSTQGTSGNPYGNTGALLSTTALGVTVAGVGLLIWMRTRRADAVPPQTGKAAQSYLRANRHQLRQDLALGAGPSLDDLAQAAEIRVEHRARFERVLREHRQELDALLDAASEEPEMALALLSRIGEWAKGDPVLVMDFQSFVARHGDAG
jgi:DNA mismatch repair ATPase MutL